MIKYGYEEGETCGRDQCKGIIKESALEGCSCHISPPCSACTTDRCYCPDCDWQGKDDMAMDDFIVNVDRITGTYKCWEPRPLDPTKLDYHNKPHSNSSMIKEGVYPPEMTMKEVLAQVVGTFGGRFEHFGGGKFKYIAYTD